MISTLRSRLWLSYAVLILSALCVVAIGLVIGLQRTPILYRNVVQRLNLAGASLSARIVEPARPTGERAEKLLEREADLRQVRFIVINNNGAIQLDVGPGSGAVLPKLDLQAKVSEDEALQAFTFVDAQGSAWLYTVFSLDNGRFLVTAAPRPSISLRAIFRDELLRPFLQAGFIAGVLALILGLFIGQWISNPLKRMASLARRMETGHYEAIPLEGPREVQQLGEALNEMAHRVQTSQQSQREFVANVSHELKTPLTSIQGFSQAILDGAVQTPEAMAQAASVIYNEAGRMYRLVLDLLALARLEAGTADLQRAPVDLSVILKGIGDKFSLQAQQAKVTLSLELSQVPEILGDGDRLAQVFTNLVDNALKFTPPGGMVRLSSGLMEGAVQVQVSDTGVGIGADDLPRIFERFYQVDKSRQGGAGRGVGLGLAIASQIVAAHGGEIKASSQPGKGSIFSVRLPILPPSGAAKDVRRRIPK